MLKKFKSKDCLVKPGKSAHLTKRETDVEHFYSDEDDAEEQLEKMTKAIADRQELLYADRRFGVLVILQGMDAAGKDGAIKHITTGLNPMGVTVHAFSSPSEDERAHDFLWRTHGRIPPRGKIGIFNRSYYEEVTTVRVHPEFFHKQNLIADGSWNSKFWSKRNEAIHQHEKALSLEGYQVIKFFLNISREEQKARLLARIEESEKNWKFDPADMVARSRWDKYLEAYEDSISETSSKQAPWFIIPADDKPNARLMISHILLEHLKTLPLRFPHVSEQRVEELQHIAKKLKSSK